MDGHRHRALFTPRSVAGVFLLAAALGARPPGAATVHARTRGPEAPGRPAALPLPTGRLDSSAIEATARRAQAVFERDRRRRLPVQRVAYGPCPERVGRFCHWFEDDGVEPRPEPASISALRIRLLDRLDSAFSRLPGSRWISGQRVRYRIEAGRPADALAAARACRASGAWCSRLVGMALHALGREREAEAAFRSALRAETPAERCESEDLSVLLEGEARSHYERLSCPGAGRRVFDRRFWWLADPLYLQPGNERWVEDQVRRLTSALQEEAASPYDVRWGEDLTELTIRYGWPAWWERVPEDPLRPGDLHSWIAHDPPHGLSFAPRADPLTPPGDLTPEAWRLDDVRPRSTYATSYADTFVRLPSRAAVFRRGDSVLVLAAYAFPGPAGGAGRRPDGRDEHGDVAALLLLAGGPGDAYGRRMLETAPRSGVLSARAPARGLLLAVEALDRRRRVAARLRRGMDLRPPAEGTPSISGLLAGPSRAALPTGDGSSGPLPTAGVDPVSLAARLGLAGPGPAAAPATRPGQTIELYWELYGLPAGGSGVRIEVTLREDEAGSFDPVHPTPPSRGRPRVRLAWSTGRGQRASAYPYRVGLSLPRSLRGGLYAVEVRARIPGWTPLVSRAPVLVWPDPEPAPKGLHS
jgi:hypothetical protein